MKLKHGNICVSFNVDCCKANMSNYLNTNLQYKSVDEATIIDENLDAVVEEFGKNLSLNNIADYLTYIRAGVLCELVPELPGFLVNYANQALNAANQIDIEKYDTTTRVTSVYHIRIRDGKDITIYIGEKFDDRGVFYLIADIESRYIIFASIPDYTDYYKMVKFEPGANEIHNKFNDKDIFEYIDMDESRKSEIFDNIEILDF